MQFLRLILSVAFLFSAVETSFSADTRNKPQEKLETAIPEAIRLMRSKDYRAFMEQFVAPDDLKKMKEDKNQSFDDLVKNFDGPKAERLLKALKKAKGMKPRLEQDGKIAKYVFTQEQIAGAEKGLIFVKVDNLWYITN